jgi:prepilin-type N-terminal cleavage/methylation domain-containing protein
MRKTGFSLVELSIVILVIGVVMLMITKGRHLVETVRMKKDMSTIMRLQNALYEYYAMYGTELDSALYTDPEDAGTTVSKINLESTFVAEGLLRPADYYSPTSKAYWGLYHCTLPSGNAGSWDYGMPQADAYHASPNGDIICAGMYAPDKMSARLVCNIERTMDEVLDDALMPTWRGLGRVAQFEDRSPPEYTLTPEDYEDCRNVPKDARLNYFYRITKN